MKTLLAVLLSFIMVEAPVLARDTYTIPGSSASLVGTYAGVLIPTQDNIIGAQAANIGLNALGLFTLGIPTTGIGGGTAIIFSSGRTFTGSIQALANPDPSANGIEGILNATFNYSLYVATAGSNGGTTITTLAVTANAQGEFDAAAVSDAASVGGLGVDLSGTSVVSIDQGFVGNNGAPVITEQVTFAIEGFLQSQTASTTTSGT